MPRLAATRNWFLRRYTASCTHRLSAFSFLVIPTRSVVQSNMTGGPRSLLDRFETRELVTRLRRNRNGNYYRFRQKLWPSQEALEKATTTMTYSPVEQQPLALLPQREAPRQVFACEGRGGSMLLGAVETEERGASASQSSPAPAAVPLLRSQSESGVDSDSLDFMEEVLRADQSVSSKIMTEADVRGTVLESASTRARQILAGDLTCNPVTASHSTSIFLRRPAESTDAAGISWSALGLDAPISSAAEQLYGPVPTRLQTRLLSALLHEDHNDVLFNGVTGSGKTSALVLALLQGIRSEAAGMNVLVATNTMNAMRLHDTVKALCRRAGGGVVVDRPADDYSWLFLGTYREDHESYYRQLRRGLRRSTGPARLFITTAGVMCQLLFEKKMEFEDFGYLRRVYVDDVGAQVPMLPESVPVEVVRERLRNPLAAELLLGTLHQLPGPHIRSVLQLALVSADVDGKLKDHLQGLCMKPVVQTTVLSAVRVPSAVHCLFLSRTQGRPLHLPCARPVECAGDDSRPRCSLCSRCGRCAQCTPATPRARRRCQALLGGIRGQRVQGRLEVSALEGVRGLRCRLAPRLACLYQLCADVMAEPPMCGRTGRMGNVGWVYVVSDKQEAKRVRQVAEALSVDFSNHVIDDDLQQVLPAHVERFTKQPELYGLDPQFAVRQHYTVQAGSPDMAYRKREFFSKPAIRQFQMEDYTSIPLKQRRFDHARQLSQDVARNPSLVLDMQKQGLLDARLKPTTKLKRCMDATTNRHAPDLFQKGQHRCQ
ncbi:LOW QUALITY PROTEIN: putative ATP dependent DEAD-box helicase [Leishmania braziliensis MHOM/BR/75/M2904]|uniref:ATP dependent DEAD-box helicase n=1 Tax=Leishmania braziliensis TaxID=5660 RepID=A4HAQ8_LEIBR|nr:LOW QUALITY PROTEIN: putative ATP dependent DEAD-box helicase [Leishmania braziliensis MHOM/BR/75/M2904]CAM38491.1 putative ATP dependent DEAD-box helicase [Leishmania braziliensis MHOM/BR/75/M2904]